MIHLGEQPCLLCGNENATLILRDHGNYKDYECPSCRRFVISSADEHLISNSIQLRQQYSLESRQVEDGFLLHIFVEVISNGKSFFSKKEVVAKWNETQ